MIAQIYSGETVYASPVMAYRERGWRREAVVFDSEFKRLIRIKTIFGHCIFVLDWEGCNSHLGSWRMEPWLLENNALRKAIRRCGEASVEAFPILKNYAVSPMLPEWTEVKNETDVYNLMSLCMNGPMI